eukprot:7518595-Karenia_brevis.AAC.1
MHYVGVLKLVRNKNGEQLVFAPETRAHLDLPNADKGGADDWELDESDLTPGVYICSSQSAFAEPFYVNPLFPPVDKPSTGRLLRPWTSDPENPTKPPAKRQASDKALSLFP